MLKYFNILQKNDYRGKWQLLLWSLLPLLLICYLLAFKKTFGIINEFNNNRQQALLSDVRRDSASIYDAKLASVDSWKKQYMLDSNMMDAQVIAAINRSCDELGISFKEYKPLGLSSQRVWSRMVKVQGDFQNILKLVYELEQSNKICRVASLDFQKKKGSGEEQDELYCIFYIQNVIKQ